MADNNSFQNKVTTSGITLFDENGVMFRMGYLDDSLSLLMGLPSVADNGKRSYPQELRYPFIITMDRACALYNEIIVKKVLPALEAGEDYNGGIFLNKRKDAIFEIRIQQGDIYLAYHKEIGDDRQPKNSYVFKCGKTAVVEGYNTDGSTFEQSNVEGVFMMVCKYFEAGIYDLNHAGTHSFRKANSHTTNAIFNYLKGIALKLGVTPEGRGYNNYHTNNQNTPFPSVDDMVEEELPFKGEPAPSSSLNDLIS